MVIKEIRITHSGGFQDGERRGIRALIHSNVIIAFKVLLKIMQGENMQLEDERAKVYTDLIAPTGPNMVDGVAFTGKGIEPSVDFAHSLHNTLAHPVPLGRVLSAMDLKHSKLRAGLILGHVGKLFYIHINS